MTYNSAQDTWDHIENVRRFLNEVVLEIDQRAVHHDESKLEEPEKSMYDKYTPKLRELTYGNDEYKQTLKDMGPALKHHYENNSHHPEYYSNGINGMSLLDLIEMLADWKAAGMRHSDGNMQQSLEVNKKRFGIYDQLAEILQNTVKELGW